MEQLRSEWLVVAAHHPCFSLDETHGGYVDMMSAMDAAFLASGHIPDLVLAGHVHSYQRFSRDFLAKTLPYIVAGAGGFANSSRSLHKLQRGLAVDRLPFTTSLRTVRLESYDVMNAGFLRVKASTAGLKVEYFSMCFDDPADYNSTRDRLGHDREQKRAKNGTIAAARVFAHIG